MSVATAAPAAPPPGPSLAQRLNACADMWERDADLYTGRRRAWRLERAAHLRERADYWTVYLG